MNEQERGKQLVARVRERIDGFDLDAAMTEGTGSDGQ